MLVEMTVTKEKKVTEAVYSEGLFMLLGDQIISLNEEYAIQAEINGVLENLTPDLGDPYLIVGDIVSRHFDTVEVTQTDAEPELEGVVY